MLRRRHKPEDIAAPVDVPGKAGIQLPAGE